MSAKHELFFCSGCGRSIDPGEVDSVMGHPRTEMDPEDEEPMQVHCGPIIKFVPAPPESKGLDLEACPECHMTGPHKLQCSRRLRAGATMGEPMFPHGMRWADIFCPGSRPSDYNWGHLPDANGRCQRCDYSQPADLRERLSQGNGPVVITIPRDERKNVARRLRSSGRK